MRLLTPHPEVELKKLLSEEGEQKPSHKPSEDMQGIIIDHTNKYTVVENWLFARGDLGVCDKLIYIVHLSHGPTVKESGRLIKR